MIVRSIRNLKNGCVLIDVTSISDEPLPDSLPGQFVNIKVPDTEGVFLRRPISICDVKDNNLTLYIKPAGKGTERLCSMRVGDTIDVLMPLGHPFTIHADGQNLLVGGGVGIAPLLYLGRVLHMRGQRVSFLLGGASHADLELLPLFKMFGDVYVTTVDGSMGTRGFVTDHEIMQSLPDHVYACGPTPMMKALAHTVASRGKWMEASLENHMACGLGACLCCVENTVSGNRCVCTDGPVFNINDLKW